MQSIFRLPWCSDTFGPDAPKPDMTVLQKPRPASVVDMSVLNKLKRKRSDSAAPLDSPFDRDSKRRRPCDTGLPIPSALGNYKESQAPVSGGKFDGRRDSPVSEDSSVLNNRQDSFDVADAVSANHVRGAKMDDGAPLAASQIIASNASPIQQAIQHQFDLEILMKHRELRLIEQELAKCQVALEQLRRCELMPFPGSDGFSANVSSGIGAALRAQSGYSQPQAPAPWGVTDGPYTKHYASWLLPDQTFDSVSNTQSAFPEFAAIRGDGRPSRTSVGAWAKPSKRSFHRDSISGYPPQVASHTASPAPTPRAKGGPLVLKRLSDNQYVKLVCTKCHRSDFSSVQGFLNHCRIAHKIDYKSHEAAAQDCGHVLEDHEAELAATAPPPVGSAIRAPVPKPAPPQPVVSKVHHLNHDIIPRPTWKSQRSAYIEALNKQQTAPVPTIFSGSVTASKALVPSASQPFLSAHLARNGVGIDLKAIVARLGEKIDLGPEPEDMDDFIASPKASGEQTGSRKGFHQAGNRPRPAPLQMPTMDSSEHPASPSEHDLSPRTADSNPGMVSDNEDDPNSDIEDTGSVIVPTDTVHVHEGCGDAMDIDLEVDDDHDGHAVIIRSRGSLRSDGGLDERGSGSRARGHFGRREK